MKKISSKITKNIIFLIIILILFSQEIFSQETRKVEDIKKRGLDLKHHKDRNGKIRDDLYRKSFSDFMKVKKGIGAQMTNSSQWNLEGPAPSNVNSAISQNGQLPGPNAGSIFDIAIDPSGTTDKIVYIVSEEGGVWKTINGGASWFPLTDTLKTLSFGAVALDPGNSNTVYAGTGNSYIWWESFNKNGKNYKAVGIYVSTNGGNSWALTKGSSALNGININKIIIPSSGVLLVATSNGLFRSTDGGNSFNQVALGGETNLYISDIDKQEGNNNNIWVSASGKGIFYSSNMGQSFGNNLWTSTNGGPTTDFDFISMAVSTDGQTLYSNASLKPGVGVWKSTTSGQSWINITSNAVNNGQTVPYWRQVNNCQCGYDQTMGVDPTNSNRVYMGFQDLWLSNDGGNTWRDVSYTDTTYQSEQMHVDHHALTFSPSSHRGSGQPVGIWVGNDGGIWNSTNNGIIWNVHNQGPSVDSSLATQLFRYIDMGRGKGNNGWTYGGTQDNGTSVGNPTITSSGWQQTWNEWLGGDGSFTTTDWQDPKVAYGNWGNANYTHDGGISAKWPNINCSNGSFSVIRVGPQNRAVYLAATCNNTHTLFVSTNLGANYTPKYTFSNAISSIAVSASDSNLIYISCNDGSINKMRFSNDSVTLISSSKIPNTPNTTPQLTVNPVNSQMIVSVYSGYSGTNLPSKHVFLSMDGGANWKDISGSIAGADVPDMAIYSVVIDPNTIPNSILISSDFGVMRSFDYGLTWHVLGNNLPNTHAVDLALDPLVNPSMVKVGTYGRSIWKDTLAVGSYVFGPLSLNKMVVENINWLNSSSDTLTISYIAQDGTGEIPFGKLYQNTPVIYGPAYFIGVNVVRDKLNNIVFVYVISGNGNQTISISQSAVNEAKSNQLKNYPGIRSYPTWRRVNNFNVYNNSNITINLNWINPSGISQLIGVLKAGANTIVGPVYFGGTFTATDSNGKLIGIYVASDASNQPFTITNDMVNFWK